MITQQAPFVTVQTEFADELLVAGRLLGLAPYVFQDGRIRKHSFTFAWPLQKEGLSFDSSLGRERVSVQLAGTSGWLLRMLPTRYVSCSCLPRNHYTSRAGTD